MIGQQFPLRVAARVVAAGFGGTADRRHFLEQLVAAAESASQESAR